MDTTGSAILGFLGGVVVTVLGIYWFRSCFDLLSALLDRDLTSSGQDLIIFGVGLCGVAGLIIVLMPGTLSTVALLFLYGGIAAGLALAGSGLYLMHKEKKERKAGVRS